MKSVKGVKPGDVLWECDCEPDWFDDGGAEMADVHISTDSGCLSPCFVVDLGDGKLGYTRPDFAHERTDAMVAYASVYDLNASDGLSRTPLDAMRHDLAMKRKYEQEYRLAAEWLEREIGRVERGEADL